MRNAKTIIIGIACAMALAYIISGIYDKAVGGDDTDGSAKSGRNVCIYDNGELFPRGCGRVYSIDAGGNDE